MLSSSAHTASWLGICSSCQNSDEVSITSREVLWKLSTSCWYTKMRDGKMRLTAVRLSISPFSKAHFALWSEGVTCSCVDIWGKRQCRCSLETLTPVPMPDIRLAFLSLFLLLRPQQINLVVGLAATWMVSTKSDERSQHFGLQVCMCGNFMKVSSGM